MAKKKDIHPGDITRVLSQSMAKGSAPPARKSVVQDRGPCDVLSCKPTHPILGFKPPTRQRTGALIDRSANGGIAGDDV
jgi:hypothetical protein